MAVTAKFDGTFRALAARARGVLPAVMAPAVDGTARVLAGARSGWPVKTGRSRAGLAEEQTATEQTSTVAIVDPVGYTLAVRRGESWRQLVSEPMAALVRSLVPKMGTATVEALRRR